jgi:DGQHR domain-containing protein
MAAKKSFSASLITQGEHKFFTLTLPMSILADACFVVEREKDTNAGFQRLLDENRAFEIANYIDNENGVIPTSIILSAQPETDFQYNSAKKTVSFVPTKNSFLIIDGQHRVYGFKKAKSDLRVPVVIFSGLSKTQEARLFIDINTKQKPVPNELLLDIKNLARYESENEEYMRALYDYFYDKADSFFKGLMTPTKKEKNKITRVTFNNAIKHALPQIINNQPETVYGILNNYFYAFSRTMTSTDNPKLLLTNPTLFTAVTSIFPKVSLRVKDRFGSKYSIDNFYDILKPISNAVRATVFKTPGKSYKKITDQFNAAIEKVDLTF